MTYSLLPRENVFCSSQQPWVQSVFYSVKVTIRKSRFSCAFMAWNQSPPGHQPGYNPAYVSTFCPVHFFWSRKINAAVSGIALWITSFCVLPFLYNYSIHLFLFCFCYGPWRQTAYLQIFSPISCRPDLYMISLFHADMQTVWNCREN